MRFSPRDLSPRSQLIALAAAAVPLLLLAMGIYFAADGANAVLTDRRAGAFYALSTQERMESHDRKTVRAIWVEGATPGLAAAALEKRISDVLSANQLEQKSIEMLHGDGPESALSVSVSASGKLAGLRRALYALEAGTPLVFVSGMEIQSEDGTPSQIASQASRELSVRLTLHSFAAGGGTQR